MPVFLQIEVQAVTRTIDLWFSAGSTYTYLTMMRIGGLESCHHVSFRLRPMFLIRIMRERNHIPFVTDPTKLNYMWRDIERRANSRRLTPVIPAPFPNKHTDFANLLAFVALRETWGRQYIENSFRYWFEEGHLPGAEPNISKSLLPIGEDTERVVRQAAAPEVKDELMGETEIARSLGIFGSPTCVVGDELFWGDDRLEDAIAWVHEQR